MRLARLIRLAPLLSLWLPDRSAAQTSADTLAIEVAAARAMLTRRTADGPVSIDPGLARHGHSPGPPVPGWERPTRRSEALAQALGVALGSGVRILPIAETRRCGNVERIRCRLAEVAVHLTFSNPVVDGDTAVVTVTLLENSGRPRPATHYATALFTLQRTADGWIVIREATLGES